MNTYKLDVLTVCFDPTGRVVYNVNQAYVAAYLRQKGVGVDVYLSESVLLMDKLVEDMLAMKPQCIFFYCHDQNYRLVREAAKRIKGKQHEKILLIVSGPAATYSSDILPHIIPEVDVCIQNDNEEEIYNFVLHMKWNVTL